MNNDCSKNAIIFHGTGGHPDAIWYKWQKEELENRGYLVDLPHYPGLNIEPISSFLSVVLEAHTYCSTTVLIGHSGGAALLLAILEALPVKVHSTFMIAGYWTPPNNEAEPVLKPEYNWSKIKKNGGDIYIINSLKDPYGCDSSQGSYIFGKTGGTQIIMNEGHFGDYNQPYPKFPLLNKLIP